MSNFNPGWFAWQMALVWLVAAAVLFPLGFTIAGGIALFAGILTAYKR